MLFLVSILSGLADAIWGSAFGRPSSWFGINSGFANSILDERPVYIALMMAIFTFAFSWKVALVVLVPCLIRRLLGWRNYINGDVFLPMTKFPEHPFWMFAHSLPLVLIPFLSTLIGFAVTPNIYLAFALLALAIAIVYYVVMNLFKSLSRVHHIAEFLSGAMIGAVSYIFFSGII